MMRNFVALSILLSAFACSNSRIQTTSVNLENQWDTIRPLANPRQGLVPPHARQRSKQIFNRNDKDLTGFPGMDHLYLRLCWAYLEPEEGKFNWAVIDTIIDKYVPMGYGISFRISCKETGGAPGSVPREIDGVRYATPYWVSRQVQKELIAPNLGVPAHGLRFGMTLFF